MRLLHIAIAAVCGSLMTLGTQKVVRAMKPPRPPPVFDLPAYIAHGHKVRDIWRLSSVRPDIIMVGDSITAGAPWADITGCTGVVTRAMGGDYAEHVASRVDDLIAERPKAVVLMIGVNDLNMALAPETIARTIVDIVDRLTAAGIAVYRLPVLPVSINYPSLVITNATINALNAAVATVAGAPQIDPRQALAPGGSLTSRVSTDGLHLTATGYAILRDALQPVFDRYCVSRTGTD